MPVIDNRVWTFPPNWGDGVLETLEWKTDVLASEVGIEQRIARRQTPRRTFEASFLVQKRDRAYLDNFLSAVGRSEFYVPIWHDLSWTKLSALAGTDFLTMDTAYREYKQGGKVILRGQHSRDYEIGTIDEVHADGLKLIANLGRDWMYNTRVYPLSPGRLDDDVNVTKGTDTFMRLSARFILTQANPFSEEAPDGFYQGSAIIVSRPDESEDVTHNYLRLVAMLDNDAAIPDVYDYAQHGFAMQQYRWGFASRSKQAELRGFLYHMTGKLRTVWLPTFMQDFTLKAVFNPGDSAIIVENVGYTELGMVNQPGRTDIRIELHDGSCTYHRILGGTVVDANLEVLALDGDITDAITPSRVRCISFMTLCRLDNDKIEISHDADSDGLTRSTVTFKSSPGLRTAEPWEERPFGDTEMNDIQAVCDCLCSDFDIVNEYTEIKNPQFGDPDFPLAPEWIAYPETPRIGAGEAAWLEFYLNFPWISPPLGDVEADLASFPTKTQAQARDVQAAVGQFLLTQPEIDALTPDATQYSDLCSDPGNAFPRSLPPTLPALREAYIRQAWESSFGYRYRLDMLRYNVEVPAPVGVNLLAEFCCNPQWLVFEQWHRKAGHQSDMRGAVAQAFPMALSLDFAFKPDGAGFSYTAGQHTTINNEVGPFYQRLSKSFDKATVLRPKSGGIPLVFYEGHESWQYSPVFGCDNAAFPMDGSYSADFWDEWTWTSGGCFLSDAAWPEWITVTVSNIAPSRAVASARYRCVAIEGPDGKFLNYWYRAHQIEINNSYEANPFPYSYEMIPLPQKSYLVRVYTAEAPPPTSGGMLGGGTPGDQP